MYKRHVYQAIFNRLNEPRRFLQVLAGPRQVGKTTLAHQIKDSVPMIAHYASADEPGVRGTIWIEQQWDLARIRARETGAEGAVLILDEIQKISQWSEVIKRLWDQDTANKINLKVMILGSSALLIQSGLTESLAGRFELIPVSHWSFQECMEAFGWTLEQFIYFGGYPGAATLIEDEERWSRYIRDSLIETTISKDIMLMTRVHKPALLRQVFELGCRYSGQILSYQKMLGQLQEAGNATTLAHYIDLLSGASMLCGLQKYFQGLVRQKASSPKLQVFNTALVTAQYPLSFKTALEDRQVWGRLVESAIGAHLINTTRGSKIQVSYWREGDKEVDFVLSRGEQLITLEVKSGAQGMRRLGIESFAQQFKPQANILVGGDGVPIEEFLSRQPDYWFDNIVGKIGR